MRFRKFILLVFAILLLGLSACRPAYIGSNLFTEKCKAPCWRNIILGETEFEEAIQKLKQMKDINPESVTTHGEPWSIFEDKVYFESTSKNWEGIAYLFHGKIMYFELYGDWTFPFEDAINLLGSPSFVICMPLSGGLPGRPMKNGYSIEAIEPKKGFTLQSNIKYRNIFFPEELMITPTTNVNRVSFFAPEIFDNLVDARLFSWGLLDGRETRAFFSEWNGYGSIKEKYPSVNIK